MQQPTPLLYFKTKLFQLWQVLIFHALNIFALYFPQFKTSYNSYLILAVPLENSKKTRIPDAKKNIHILHGITYHSMQRHK